MKIYGLTGGIASGKSEAARRFRELAVPVIDADKIGHALIEPGGAAEAEVLAAFGGDILSDGRIDRAKLGQRVFADRAELEKLNAIVHPAIKAEVARRAAALAEEGHEFVVIDAALLGEGGKIAGYIDGLALVLAPVATRLERLVQQRGCTEAEAKRRIEAQTPPERKIPLADWIIQNDGTLDALRARVDDVARAMRARALGERELG